MRVGDRVRVVEGGATVSGWESEGVVKWIGLNHDLVTRILQVSFEDPRLVYGFTRDQLEYVEEED